jgi:glutathione S-transferase
MTLDLYAHPFSSYCQKVLIAFYENGTPFRFRMLGPDDPQALAEWTSLWPLQRMPLLVDAGRPVMESTVIIEHLGLHHPGKVRLIPAEPEAALPVRMLDRFFDNYVSTPLQRIVFDSLRPKDIRDSHGVGEAKAVLDRAYAWLEATLSGREWAAGETFGLADCAAAPALFYADWAHPIPAERRAVKDYRRRLLARPSFARAVEEARPYRHLFPLGAPDRD